MTPSTKQPTFRKYVLRGLFLLCITLMSGALGLVSPAHADLVCQPLIEVSQEKPQIEAIALSDTQLVWRTKRAIKRYDIAGQTLHTVAENVVSRRYKYFVEVNGDHIIWTDKDDRVYLHTLSTGQTIKVSRGKVSPDHPMIDGGYIVYGRKTKHTSSDGSLRLVLYETATGLTRTVAASVFPGWGLDDGRVVYHDKTQAYLYDITSGLTDVITTREAVYSASIDGQRIVYMAGIPKSYDGDDWLSRDLFLYDLDTQTHTQVTDADYYTRISGAWIDDASDTIVWKQVVELADYNDTYLYDILTGAARRISNRDLKHYEFFEPDEIDGRLIGALDIYQDETIGINVSRAGAYDRISEVILPITAEGYNSGRHTQLSGGYIAWVATQVDQGYAIVKNAVFLSTNCIVTPTIRAQSAGGQVIAGRPKTLHVEAVGDLPLSYQWYQGEAGDTSVPVGENSPVYTSPDLIIPVSYWVRVTNPVGSTDGDTIALSPEPSYQLVGNEGFENPLHKQGGFWDDFGINRDFPKTQRVCNTPDNLTALEGECAYRFGKPEKNASYKLHYIEQFLTWKLPQVEVGDVLTVSAYVNSINASDVPYITLEVWYADDQPDAVLTLEGDPNAEGYTLMTGTLTLTSVDIWLVDLYIGYPGKRGRVFFDAVTVTASAGYSLTGENAPVLLPLPDAPGDLRQGDSSLSNEPDDLSEDG